MCSYYWDRRLVFLSVTFHIVCGVHNHTFQRSGTLRCVQCFVHSIAGHGIDAHRETYCGSADERFLVST